MNMGSYKCLNSSGRETKKIAYLSGILKLVSEESRLKLLCMLRQKEHCVCELTEQVGMSQSLISHHLSDLKEAKFVNDKKRGTFVYYSLTDKGRFITDLLFSIYEKEVVKK